MGCDIHSVIEYKKDNSNSRFNALSNGEISIPRDYELFSAIGLAENEPPLPFPTRGLPFDCSDRVRDLFFDDADEVKEILSLMRDEDVSEEEMIDAYIDDTGECIAEEYRLNNRLPNVDFYGASWLNYYELLKAVVESELKVAELSDEFQSVIETFRKLTDQYGAENVRFVFWFDGAG
jgi:hypothetical protein